jgi:hypothetical protein
VAAVTEIASLSQVKNYLRMPNPTGTSGDDATITILMNAAQAVVERELGHIVATPISAERHDGGYAEIWLRHLPVLYVQNVEEGWGYYDWQLDDQEVNQQPALSIWAYSLDMPEEGLVTRRGPGNVLYPFVQGRNNIRVDYVAGRNEVPANAIQAFLELTAHWYRVSQLRTSNQASAGFSPNVLNQDFVASGNVAGLTSINMGIPSEIIELLKPDRRRPIVG